MDRRVYDIGIIGAGFAGLACARAAARRGLRVLVIDRKAEPGQRMHTTGLLVKEAAERWEIPATLTRRVRGIRLYAPALAALDLAASGYYFLATDTPALMRWLAREARRAGAHLRLARPYRGVRRVAGGFELNGGGERVRYLIGADGPHSQVAAEFR
ncbi:MAG: FAD-dependent oxidoreductase, partial [Casimicrobiaceae bacterium]